MGSNILMYFLHEMKYNLLTIIIYYVLIILIYNNIWHAWGKLMGQTQSSLRIFYLFIFLSSQPFAFNCKHWSYQLKKNCYANSS